MKKSSLILGAVLIAAGVATVVAISSGGDTKVDSTKASFKILGTWVKVDDPTNKAVFTADSVTEISGGHTMETLKYNWINEQEIDITIDTLKKARTKITIDGDSLTMSVDGNEVKFIREGASSIEESSFIEVTIGTQVWMTENLNVYTFSNGDTIPQAKTYEEWEKAGNNQQPAWCYYDNDSTNGEKYGKLYNWYAVNDSRGLAPKGWHVPSDEEWTILTDFLGGKKVAGTKMKSTSGWQENGNGTNESGFSGLPGGYRRLIEDLFSNVTEYGVWWSSSENNTEENNTAFAWYRNLFYNDGNLNRDGLNKQDGFSVRCLRD